MSVGYGYSTLAFNKFSSKYHECPDAKEVAILGSGYMGLFTALLLKKNGYNVTIYADKTVKNDGLCSMTDEKLGPTTS